MRRRLTPRFRPAIEPFEGRQMLSTASAVAGLHEALASRGHDHPPAMLRAHAASGPHARHRARPMSIAGPLEPSVGFALSRITQTSAGNSVHLVPPFQQVLVQARQPVPGRMYNVLSVVVRNHTARTFTADDDFSVKLTGQSHSTPVLTGNQQWRPGQWIVFYVLTHQYYPAHPEVSGGFAFDLNGSRGVAIPGPSGIFLRLTYRPSTFARTLNWITAHGPGAEGGPGASAGLPDTQIWEFQFAAGRHFARRSG